MCGRYAITLPPEAMAQLFQARWDGPAWGPRYNVAPSQAIPIVRLDDAGDREIALAAWGLHPGWMKEPPGSKSMINARSETAAEKPFFRDAMKKRRCLVAADGYYEWKREGQGKVPYFIAPAEGGVLVFAGLWERWRDRDSDAFVDTAAILTAPAHADIAFLHDRMPVALAPEAWGAWLDRKSKPDMVNILIEAAIAAPPAFAARPVSKAVNSPAHEGPQLIQPVG